MGKLLTVLAHRTNSTKLSLTNKLHIKQRRLPVGEGKIKKSTRMSVHAG
jgi:hypothetical protein